MNIGGSETTTKSTKRVVFHPPNNVIHIISPIRNPVKSLKRRYPDCNGYKYPCMYKRAIIDNVKELQDYMAILAEKNESTRKNRQKTHKTKIFSKLMEEGNYAKEIPPEFRVHKIETGEIFDIRELVKDTTSFHQDSKDIIKNKDSTTKVVPHIQQHRIPQENIEKGCVDNCKIQ
jgi:hypothetical protein